MKIRKYNDEQLSRILSAAAEGDLGSVAGACSVCIEQAALATEESTSTETVWEAGVIRREVKTEINDLNAQYFDTAIGEGEYWQEERCMDPVNPKGILTEQKLQNPTQVLRWLERNGMA